MPRPEGVTVKRSRAGLGLFATREFTKDEEIIEYTGEKITAEEADRRGGKYLFTLNEEWTLDGKGREHIGRYINHSCRPNAYAELTYEEDAVFIKAKRRIKAGEEITFHYGKDYFERIIKPMGCRCENCAAAS